MNTTKIVVLVLLTTLGCRATTPAPEVETVGTLTESYASIAPPPPRKQVAVVVESTVVARDETPVVVERVEAEEAPEVVQKAAHGF